LAAALFLTLATLKADANTGDAAILFICFN